MLFVSKKTSLKVQAVSVTVSSPPVCTVTSPVTLPLPVKCALPPDLMLTAAEISQPSFIVRSPPLLMVTASRKSVFAAVTVPESETVLSNTVKSIVTFPPSAALPLMLVPRSIRVSPPTIFTSSKPPISVTTDFPSVTFLSKEPPVMVTVEPFTTTVPLMV